MEVNGVEYDIIKLLGKGKGGYSYLVSADGSFYVLKQIHHEPCEYYTFGNKIEAEKNDYARLKAAGLRIPEMLAIDLDNERILKQYIAGPTAQELVARKLMDENCLSQLKEMAAKARAAGLNIDYYPTNFILQESLLYYIDYECNEYMPQWSLEEWGMQYWK